MGWRERIVVDPRILVGKPVIKGTRIAVEFVLELLSLGWSIDQITGSYPGLPSDDVMACLSYATDIVKSERVYPLPA